MLTMHAYTSSAMLQHSRHGVQCLFRQRHRSSPRLHQMLLLHPPLRIGVPGISAEGRKGGQHACISQHMGGMLPRQREPLGALAPVRQQLRPHAGRVAVHILLLRALPSTEV